MPFAAVWQNAPGETYDEGGAARLSAVPSRSQGGQQRADGPYRSDWLSPEHVGPFYRGGDSHACHFMRLTTTSCPSIALLVDFLASGYQRDIIDGVSRAVSARGANLLVFVGGWFLDESLETEGNVIYRHIGKAGVDGAVAAMSTLINNIGAEAGRNILQAISVPRVSLGMRVSGIPSVATDNRAGLHEMCKHLAVDHGYRRFAMIAGPEQNEESIERIQTCKDSLAGFGATLEESHITRQGFMISSGKAGIKELFDGRHLGAAKLDAIICASDLIAEGALLALAERGVRVPRDLALTGFDDLDRACYLIPPLSSVRQPVIDLGVSAARLLLQSLDGVEAPPSVTLPSTAVVRGSCGCLAYGVKTAAPAPPRGGPSTERTRSFDAALKLVQRHDLICASLARSARGQFTGAEIGWESRWVMALFADLGDQKQEGFLPQLERVLGNIAQDRSQLELCRELLGVLRDESLSALGDSAASRRLEDLVHSARLMTSGALERLEVSRRLETTAALNGALVAVARLMRLVGHPDFWTHLEREVTDLGIHTCYVTRYVPGSLVSSSYVFGFSSVEALPRDLLGRVFPSAALVPGELLRRPRAYGVVVQALISRRQPLGTLFLSLTARDIATYEPFAAVIALELAQNVTEEALSARGSSR
jgi:DNA-binding LacI/PurR family transcriptional regulator